MAEITATLVKQLRDRTGQAMMDCKKALGETAGDVEKAVDLLRKKGMAVMEKRGERETKEGRVVSRVKEDASSGAMVMLCSETDFTAKNDKFQETVEAMAGALLAAESVPESEEGLKALSAGAKTVDELVNEVISTTGEKVTFGPFARFDVDGAGMVYAYVHFNGKIGTLIQIDAENDAAAAHDATKALASDLAMHITAVNPMAVNRDDMPAEEVAREEEVARGQVTDKPANIIDKIVQGKMGKWFQQHVLLEQPFVKDDSKNVQQLVDEVSKTVGGKLTVKRFLRLQIG